MLQVFCKKRFSAFIAGCSLTLVLAGGLSLANARAEIPVPIHLIAWPILALMAWSVVIGVRQLMAPPLMFVADTRGIVSYFNADNISFTDAGVSIRWEEIADITLEKRQTAGGGASNRLYTWVIACTLKADANFKVAQHSVAHRREDGNRIFCLDAFTGTVSHQELLDRLRSMWQAGSKGKDGHA